MKRFVVFVRLVREVAITLIALSKVAEIIVALANKATNCRALCIKTTHTFLDVRAK